MTTRVLIADDQMMVRQSFEAVLAAQEDLDVVGEAANGAEAVVACDALRPDVVLMDVRMPVLDGLEAARRILRTGTGTRVLMLTTFDADEYVYAALSAGASGFLLKDGPLEDLVNAVRIVAAGNALFAPSVTRRLIAEFTARRPSKRIRARLSPLTDREIEVLRLVGKGMSNVEIASALVIATPRRLSGTTISSLDFPTVRRCANTCHNPGHGAARGGDGRVDHRRTGGNRQFGVPGRRARRAPRRAALRTAFFVAGLGNRPSLPLPALRRPGLRPTGAVTGFPGVERYRGRLGDRARGHPPRLRRFPCLLVGCARVRRGAGSRPGAFVPRPGTDQPRAHGRGHPRRARAPRAPVLRSPHRPGRRGEADALDLHSASAGHRTPQGCRPCHRHVRGGDLAWHGCFPCRRRAVLDFDGVRAPATRAPRQRGQPVAGGFPHPGLRRFLHALRRRRRAVPGGDRVRGPENPSPRSLRRAAGHRGVRPPDQPDFLDQPLGLGRAAHGVPRPRPTPALARAGVRRLRLDRPLRGGHAGDRVLALGHLGHSGHRAGLAVRHRQ